MKESLTIVTFDEAENHNPSTNKVYTVFLGDMVQPGHEYKQRIDHYSVLRTIEYLFDPGTLGGNDDHRKPILSIWK